MDDDVDVDLNPVPADPAGNGAGNRVDARWPRNGHAHDELGHDHGDGTVDVTHGDQPAEIGAESSAPGQAAEIGAESSAPGQAAVAGAASVGALAAAPLLLDTSAYPGLAAADGRRRRRTALAVVVAAAAAGAAGMFVGTQIESPADRAAARAAPVPSLITVPVERRQLTAEIVLNGEVAYNEPVTVQLAGGVGIGAGETAVVTEVREAGTELTEGDLLVEVTGRPVFLLQGNLPMYRRLVIGSEGPDVLQLEEALVRLGYPVDPVDTVFDGATAAAVEQMYADRGYSAEGPSSEQQEELVSARESVTSAERAVADANAQLTEANAPLPESQRLQLEQAVNEATAAVPRAQTAAEATRVEQDQLLASARAARDTARAQRDAAVTTREAAGQPGAVDPDTGEPYSAERIAALDVAAAEAQQAYTDAEGQLVIAEQNAVNQISAADAAIGDAEAQLQIARAQYREAVQGSDNSALQDAVTAAERALEQARADLLTLEAAAGTRISPGEVVFVPIVPSTLTDSYVTLGSGIDGPIGMLATTDTLVRARVARTDAALVAVGAAVDVEIRDAGINTTGTVLSIGEPEMPAEGEQSGTGGPPGGGGTSGRLEVVVAPAADVDLGMYMWYGVRVRVQIDATEGEVLVVPVAALTVGPDEQSQVEVERVPATDDTPAATEVVPVTVGLTADGLAEVAPVDTGALTVGDRVVIGVDSNTLPGTGTGTDDGGDGDGDGDGTGSAEGDGGAAGDDGDEDEGDAGDEDEGDEEGNADAAATSPLAELFGWVSDPVEQRRQNLAIEEAVVECMQAEGWEYQPMDWEAQMPDQEEDWGSPEFGEKYGYGVMRNYELYEAGAEDGGGGGVMIEDPNMEYMNSLTPDEQEAYQAALHGDPSIWPSEPEIDENGNEFWPNPPLEEQGCHGKARLEVVGEDPGSDPAVQQALNEFYESQQNDAELDEIVRRWADCFQPKLAEYGIDTELTDIYAGNTIMETEKWKERGGEVIAVANQAEMDEYYSSGENVVMGWSDETGAGFIVLAPGEQGEPAPELTGEQIDQLTAMEIDLWKADQACQDEVGYAEYNLQREQALVDELLGEFPQLGE